MAPTSHRATLVALTALTATLVALVACGGAPESTAPMPPALPAPEPEPPWSDPATPAETALEGYATLAAAVEAAPDSIEPRRQLARVLHRAGYRERSLPLFRRNSELTPSDPTVWLDLGVALASLGRLDEAADAYARLLELRPDDPQALNNLGNVEYRRREYDRAIELYDRALERQPDYLLALYHRGRALDDSGRSREAYAAYERVLEIRPVDARALATQYDTLYRMAALDLKHGAWQRAADLYAELLSVVPDHPRAHYEYAQALTRLGRAEEAQQQLDLHVRQLPAPAK